MNQQQRDMLTRKLIASLKQLTVSIDLCAATIQSFNASVQPFAAGIEESETETHLSSNLSRVPTTLDQQPIILCDGSYAFITIETVHGLRETVKVKRTDP